METLSNFDLGENKHVPPIDGLLNKENAGQENDPFSNLSSLRLSQDFVQMAGVKKVNTALLVRKPGKQEFVRTIADPTNWFATQLFIVQEDRETYLVDSSAAELLEGDVKPHVLVPTISKQGVVFLWPIPLPGNESMGSNWHSSALDAAKLAREKWIRIYFKSLSAGQYEVLTAKADFPAPEWPDYQLADYLRLAFKDRVISNLEHVAIRRLQGMED